RRPRHATRPGPGSRPGLPGRRRPDPPPVRRRSRAGGRTAPALRRRTPPRRQPDDAGGAPAVPSHLPHRRARVPARHPPARGPLPARHPRPRHHLASLTTRSLPTGPAAPSPSGRPAAPPPAGRPDHDPSRGAPPACPAPPHRASPPTPRLRQARRERPGPSRATLPPTEGTLAEGPRSADEPSPLARPARATGLLADGLPALQR